MFGAIIRIGLAALAAFVALPAEAMAGDGTFPTQPIGSPVGTGQGPVSIAVGDFNADGREDLAVANVNDDTVTVLMGGGDGTFTSPGGPLTAGDQPRSVVVDDFNTDGLDDLAVANSQDDNISVYLGSGGGFAQAVQYAAGDGPRTIAVGDFNGDGDDDLAVVNISSANVTVRLGAGDGTFVSTAPGSPRPVGPSAIDLALGDFNSDGIEDLATASFGGGATVRIGSGNGDFPTQPPGSPFAAGVNPSGITVGDFNGDLREDLAIPNANGLNFTVRLGAGDGTFASQAPGSPFAVAQGPFQIALGDFNSDDHEDLAISSISADKLTVRLGPGDGSFAAEAPGSPYGNVNVPEGVAVGDFNADGTQDLAVANVSADDVTIMLGGGAARLAGNLLQNGGFEGVGALRTFDAPAVGIPGWQRTGGMSFARYGVSTPVFVPDRLDSRRIEGGQSFLHAGVGADASASQTVPVADRAGGIDTGGATARLSAHLGGGNVFPDRMRAGAEFLDAAGAVLGAFEIGPVTNGDRRNLTTLLHRTSTQPVPTRTRQIRVTLVARDEVGDYNGATADNVKLTLDAPPNAAPETIKGKGPKKKHRKSKAKFKFSSDDPEATFECKLAKKGFKPCTPPAKVKRLKPKRHSFLVRAVDAQGLADPSPVRFKFKVVRS